jgi:hypothetical protein
VVHEPGGETQLIALTPALACQYKAMFYSGTPDAVIIAAVQAALGLRPTPSPSRPGLLPDAGQPPRDTSRRATARRKAGRDDHR